MSDSAPYDEPGIQVTVLVDEAFETYADAGELEHVVAQTVTRAGVHAASVVLTLTDDDTVRALNRDYLDVDGATDVLSFPNSDPRNPDQSNLIIPPELTDDIGVHLGDIIIALPYAQHQAAHYGNTIDAELRLLAVHGTLHLLGYDHDTPNAQTAMWQMQEAVLSEFGDHGLSDRTYDS